MQYALFVLKIWAQKTRVFQFKYSFCRRFDSAVRGGSTTRPRPRPRHRLRRRPIQTTPVGLLYLIWIASRSTPVSPPNEKTSKITFHIPMNSFLRKWFTDQKGWWPEIKFNYTGQQNLTFFLAHEEKYLILIELLTLNWNV